MTETDRRDVGWFVVGGQRLPLGVLHVQVPTFTTVKARRKRLVPTDTDGVDLVRRFLL